MAAHVSYYVATLVIVSATRTSMSFPGTDLADSVVMRNPISGKVPMRKTRRFLFPAVLAAAVAFCGGNPPPGQAQFEDEEATRLSVENQSSLDMNIYVLRGSQRMRLGTATAHLTTRFTIPSQLIFGVTPLRFLADPIGSSRTPVTDEISVTPGDEVVLTIPPN